jgi:hypothetical protein
LMLGLPLLDDLMSNWEHFNIYCHQPPNQIDFTRKIVYTITTHRHQSRLR